MNEMKNNKVFLSGKICSEFIFDHEVYGEKFYIVYVKSCRTSENTDIIPVIVSERIVDVNVNNVGKIAYVEGQFRSHNLRKANGSRLILSVFARDFNVVDNLNYSDKNSIELDGFICKEPIFRVTPLGREISDMLIAVNRNYGRTDYIPCICWGRNAKFSNGLTVGARVRVEGRIQSREYDKKVSDSEYEKRIAYEVSVQKIELIDTDKKEIDS